METLREIIEANNDCRPAEWMCGMPEQFKGAASAEDVCRALKADGWQVFDVLIGGNLANMARKGEVEIYFDATQGVYTYHDYGHCYESAFSLSLHAPYRSGNRAERLFTKIA